MMINIRPGKRFFVLATAAIFVVGAYLFVSRMNAHTGFPLDDAWIYQTYARNLVQYHAWVYQPGQITGGATGPLWVFVLAIGYFLGIPALIWTSFAGAVLLITAGMLAARVFDRFRIAGEDVGTIAGLLIILEWHYVWAAVSGMETLLFVCLIILIFLLLIKRKKSLWNWAVVGFFIAVSVWVRPDGLTLLGPACFVAGIFPEKTKGKAAAIANLLLGFGVGFAVYLLFNFQLSGTWWPNTFYAKQAEYSVLLNVPFWQRFFRQLSLPVTGAGLLLLPGFVGSVFFGFRTRRWEIIAMFLWVLGFLGIYAYRLPVVYQHGRYAFPVIVIYDLLGFLGTVLWVNRQKKKAGLIFAKSWMLSFGIILLAFLWLGGKAYCRDVAVIDTEMVRTAYWLKKHTPSDAIIAVHDIGAIGFYSDRKIVDLAGLISPDIIPVIRDEAGIAAYLDKKSADYIVTFPGWYQQLVKNRKAVYCTESRFAPELGGENMCVYRWGGNNAINPY